MIVRFVAAFAKTKQLIIIMSEHFGVLVYTISMRHDAVYPRPLLLALLFGGLLLMLVPPVPSAAQSVQVLYVRGACRFAPPDGYEVDCGDLTVPQNRAYPQGRTVRLHVAHFHSPNPNPPADPVLYLVGGPGVSLLYDLDVLFYHFEGYLANRDVIVFDQRGTGFGWPALQCGVSNGDSEAFARDCAAFYAAWGIDLEAFSSTESAADAEDLRVALDIDQWNVVGVSYGTRLAQVIARDHPHGVRSVILDSVAELGGVNYGRFLDDAEWVRQVLRDCADDPDCGAAYPDIVATFDNLLRQFRVPSFVDLSVGTLRVDSSVIVNAAWNKAASHDGARALPMLVAAAAAGNFDPLFALETTSYTLFDLMNMAINCNDGVYGGGLCGLYGIDRGPNLAQTPADFDIPTLIVNGRWDTLTPTESAKAVWRGLPNATFVEFPYLSHGVVRSGDACAVQIAFDFLDNPTTPPTIACATATRPAFVLN